MCCCWNKTSSNTHVKAAACGPSCYLTPCDPRDGKDVFVFLTTTNSEAHLLPVLEGILNLLFARKKNKQTPSSEEPETGATPDSCRRATCSFAALDWNIKTRKFPRIDGAWHELT